MPFLCRNFQTSIIVLYTCSYYHPPPPPPQSPVAPHRVLRQCQSPLPVSASDGYPHYQSGRMELSQVPTESHPYFCCMVTPKIKEKSMPLSAIMHTVSLHRHIMAYCQFTQSDNGILSVLQLQIDNSAWFCKLFSIVQNLQNNNATN